MPAVCCARTLQASHPRIRSSSLLAACWRMGAPLSDYNIQKESTLNLSLV